ncbi:SET5 [Symbiodinium sp. CCMP2592]|nr:SET5 [Symbiodinium sp. CCMP2592]
MAAPVLRGLESKPKLNGRTVKLVEYHQDRGRWEVELEGELPPTELFQIDWNDDWWEPCDGESESFKTLCGQKGPTFKEELDGKLRKLKLLESTAKISAVDCNGRNVCVFNSDGSILQELQKKHIPRKVDTPNEVCQRSFPLHFQRKAVEGKTLAIRPSSLNVREDDTASKLRKKKVEMCVGILHRKPELDGQVGLLGPFQAHTNRWEVLPDARGLWDVKVDGSATAVQLLSSEVRDEASGDGIADPVRVGMWPQHDQQRALYANVAFRQGQIIMEEEPALVGNTAEVVKLMQQSKQLAPEQREQLSQLSKGADFVRGGRSARSSRDGNEKVTEADFLAAFNGDGSEDSGLLKSLFSFMRTFVTNSFWHQRAGARGLYLQLARVNHSCRPNAIIAEPKADFDAKRLPNGLKPADPLKKALIASRDIQPGEEITIGYLCDDELLQPSHIRREMLDSSYGFNCACDRCIDEDDDGLLRTFRCATCGGGVHSGTPSGLAPCNACGSPASEAENLVAAEQSQERIFADHCKMIPEKQQDPKLLGDMAKTCAEIGLAPDHWLVCKVHHMLACFFAQAGESARAVESLAGILHLHEKVFGSISLQKTELLGDQLLRQGDAVKAFDAYISVLKVLKLRSPNTPPSDEHCERVRQKLRAALDGKRSDSEETRHGGYAKA